MQLFNILQTVTMEVQNIPFTHGILKNAVDDDLLCNAYNEMQEIEYIDNHNDLYHFKQATIDMLKKKPYINTLITKIYSKKFRKHFDSLGFELLDQVDISSHCYSKNHYLLCHDDKIEEDDTVRKIAFILYMNKNWNPENGGSLDLFDCDNNGLPSGISKQIVPEWNTLAFFQVSDTSYHQVAMVTGDVDRYSISGWFYVKERVDKPDNLNWINPEYLLEKNQEDVLEHFSNNGHILLKNVLNKQKFELVRNALQDIQWNHQGPLNMRNLSHGSNLPVILQELKTFLSLLEFKSFLNKLTGMDCRISFNQEIRKFSHGQYKLLRDDQLEVCGLDVELYLTNSPATTEYCTMDCELVTVEPAENSLSLVYRDEGVMRYVACNTGNDRIDMIATYRQVDSTDDMDTNSVESEIVIME